MEGLICPKCAAPVGFHLTNCPRCRTFVGYPNVRRAEAMRAELDGHYTAARTDADRRGVTRQVDELDALLQHSVATITFTGLGDISLQQDARPHQ